jgi:hypothetical protein
MNLANNGAIEMGEHTTLTNASTKIESLRTTVPKSIVNFLKLKAGDKLDWDLQAHGDKMILIVTKVNDSSKK